MLASSLILSEDLASVKKLINQQVARNTKRSYRSDWKQFSIYCLERAIEPLEASPELVAMYLAYLHAKGFSENTIGHRLWAINFAFKASNLPTPADNEMVKATFQGIKRDPLTIRVSHKNPLLPVDLLPIVNSISCSSNRGRRDRALLLLGFAGAFRRSELLNLRVENLEFKSEALIITMYASKTNQEGHRETNVVVPGTTLCPIRELSSWLLKSGIKEGYVFRAISASDRVLRRSLSATALYYLFKKYMVDGGHKAKKFSPHCLRAGFVSAASDAGRSDSDIMMTTGHTDPRSLNPYRANRDRILNNAGRGLL